MRRKTKVQNNFRRLERGHHPSILFWRAHSPQDSPAMRLIVACATKPTKMDRHQPRNWRLGPFYSGQYRLQHLGSGAKYSPYVSPCPLEQYSPQSTRLLGAQAHAARGRDGREFERLMYSVGARTVGGLSARVLKAAATHVSYVGMRQQLQLN